MEQTSLFGGSPGRLESLQPQGFRYEENFISHKEEQSLLQKLGQLDLKPFEFHGHFGNRHVTSFGLKYNFSRRTVETATETPLFLDDLLSRIGSFAGYPRETFRQVGVNEYCVGAGVGWHKDKPEFGVIVGLSLGSSATIRFRRPRGKSWERVSHIVRPRSIYVLAGEARAQWKHSIPKVNDLSYSITFRTLADSNWNPVSVESY